jgi:hypothetical protein
VLAEVGEQVGQWACRRRAAGVRRCSRGLPFGERLRFTHDTGDERLADGSRLLRRPASQRFQVGNQRTAAAPGAAFAQGLQALADPRSAIAFPGGG